MFKRQSLSFRPLATLNNPIIIGVCVFMVVFSTPTRAVPVMEVKPQTVADEWIFDGRITAVHKATVSAKLAGQVSRIHFDVNEIVPEGAVILEFSNQRQKAALDQARAALEETRTRLEHAETEFKRIEGVYRNKLVSKSRYDQAVTQKRAASARLKQAQASVKIANERYTDTLVRAPYSGVVSKKHVEVGESTRVGQALMTGYALEPLKVIVHVPQSLVGAIRKAGKARVFDDRREAFSSRLTFVPALDEQVHNFEVRVLLEKSGQPWYPGTLVKVAFPAAEVQKILIPAVAVVRRHEVSGVYVSLPPAHGSKGDQGERTEFRYIRLGRRHGDRIEVLSGLNDGEKIVLQPMTVTRQKASGR